MRISAKADYAVRASAELAGATAGATLNAETLARAQDIPLKYLLNILIELKHAGLVQSHRGAGGGYLLAMPAASITVADVIRAVEGPLATVQDARPEALSYTGAAAHLPAVWVAVRSSLRNVLEVVTLADLVSGTLPRPVLTLASGPEAWVSRRLGTIPTPADGSMAHVSPLSRSALGRPPHARRRTRP